MFVVTMVLEVAAMEWMWWALMRGNGGGERVLRKVEVCVSMYVEWDLPNVQVPLELRIS